MPATGTEYQRIEVSRRSGGRRQHASGYIAMRWYCEVAGRSAPPTGKAPERTSSRPPTPPAAPQPRRPARRRPPRWALPSLPRTPATRARRRERREQGEKRGDGVADICGKGSAGRHPRPTGRRARGVAYVGPMAIFDTISTDGTPSPPSAGRTVRSSTSHRSAGSRPSTRGTGDHGATRRRFTVLGVLLAVPRAGAGDPGGDRCSTNHGVTFLTEKVEVNGESATAVRALVDTGAEATRRHPLELQKFVGGDSGVARFAPRPRRTTRHHQRDRSALG